MTLTDVFLFLFDVLKTETVIQIWLVAHRDPAG